MKFVRNRFYLFALLLSVVGHIGLIFILGNGKVAAGNYALPQRATTAVEVQLVTSDDTAVPVLPMLPDLLAVGDQDGGTKSESAILEKSATEMSSASPAASTSPEISDSQIAPPQPVLPRSDEETISPLVSIPASPHYFRADELTETPVLLQDIDPDTFMALPDNVPPHVARAYILINELGEVDQVVIDEEGLSEQVKRLVNDAFAKVKFKPAKRNGQVVKSQLSIEILLERAKATPIPIPVIMR